MDNALNDVARQHVLNHGLTMDIAGMVDLWLSTAGDDGLQRANISIGYQDGEKRRETTIVSLPTLDEALATLADRERMGAILSLGIQAMPSTKRPAAPDWVRDNAEARRTMRNLRRATALADSAARGTFADRNEAEGDAPF